MIKRVGISIANNKATQNPNKMQKVILFIILSCFTIKNVQSQITKGNWLVGGSASFSQQNPSSTAIAMFKQTNFQITPVAGYFLLDKFAVGLNPSLEYEKVSLGPSTNTIISVGPFVRYYFLEADKIFNLFGQGSYAYGSNKGKVQGRSQVEKTNNFSFSGGPVLYFNSSVGLELTVNYSTRKFVGFSGANKFLSYGIGFQIHLEK